ncbi:PucR family transcriptional regulator [Nocardia suismassiliense]|uniref:PucR family transcriptional regulator n=1 Tax=Nocardia suismassiliense TaxID=2077092 RepID=UPI001F406F9F|nr:helix-turn-helix domain-containing protein [Nocardia suismassiliense]
MTVTSSAHRDLIFSGQPVTSPLKDVRTLSRKMVGHFIENVALCRTLPGETLNGDITTITRICLELAVKMLDGSDGSESTQQLRAAAEGWAREGIPIDTIHHAVHEGFKLGFDLVVADATAADFDSLKSASRRLFEILNTITTTVSHAYVTELRTVLSDDRTTAYTLTSALLRGNCTSTMARECGIEIADSYWVVAVAFPPHPEQSNARLDPKAAAQRRLRRIQAALAEKCAGNPLSLLSVDGGTILLPATLLPNEDLDVLIDELSVAAHVPITATVITAQTAQIPGAADQAHELLDMVQWLAYPGGLYRLDQLAVEFQLTRPGPGLEWLRTVLNPLDEHPELLETLQRHFSADLSRRRTAQALHIHTNTVDYRLKRIGQLTGFDPNKLSDILHLRAALLARRYPRHTPDTAVGSAPDMPTARTRP